MQLQKKITDFLEVEDGNIGRKAMLMTGAALSASLLAESLLQEVQAGNSHTDHQDSHTNSGFWPFHTNDHGYHCYHADSLGRAMCSNAGGGGGGGDGEPEP